MLIRKLYLIIFILFITYSLKAQTEKKKRLGKNEFSGGMVLNTRPFLGASIMYKRMEKINFRIRLDGEKIEEKYNHRDDYFFIRVGADKTWLLGSWRLGSGADLFGSWIEELKDSKKVENYQIGLMSFVNIHYVISDFLSIGFEGGPKLGLYLDKSESRKGWDLKGLHSVVVMISYRF